MAYYHPKGLKRRYFHDLMYTYRKHRLDPFGEKTEALNELNAHLKNKIKEWEFEIELINGVNPFDLPHEKFRERTELRAKVEVAKEIINGVKPEVYSGDE